MFMRCNRLASGLAGTGLLLVAACSTTQQEPNHVGETGNGTPVAAAQATLEKRCQDLHRSPPHLWPEQLPPIYAGGAAAEPYLIVAFENAPAAPGSQATLAALGRIGGKDAIKLCQQLVNERAPLAVEAALALGDLPAGKDDAALLKCMQDRHSDASLRVAAACSLARHGEREHSPQFLAAIVRAGTPTGRGDEQKFGLPGKSRWARERYFVQRMLRKLGHDDLCDALDSDAPWPVLEKLAPRVAKRLARK
jgi:HEAT repeat protein